MSALELIARFASWVWGFVQQMLLPALVAMGTLRLCRPRRQKRLAARGLATTRGHEVALAVFVAFATGLAALTLFPHGFWSLDRILHGGGLDRFFSGYISWERIVERLDWLDEMLSPFQEIRRTVRVGGGWGWFLLAGNIAMFLPVGFLPGLLWRRWRWWKSLLLGFCASFTIEFVQFFIGRSTDIDDVILNTTGAVLGYAVYWVLTKLWPAVGSKCKCKEVEGHG